MDAGAVTVLYIDDVQIGTADAVEPNQKSPSPPGNPGGDDRWATTITAGDSNHDGIDELAVYGAGEDFITIIPGAATGPTGTGAKAWDQDSPGIPGSIEAGDRWGASLRFAGGAAVDDPEPYVEPRYSG